MTKILKISILLITTLLTGFSYGYFVHRNKIFPYSIIQKTQMYTIYRKSMSWSIGIYEGSTPFNLEDPEDINNPVISARDVSDVDAAFVADPFMINTKGKHYMFFEVLNMDTYSGDIGYAVSDNGKEWNYKKIILDEDFHLSYPCIYESEGSYYMIPESSEDLSVRLYKAISFPEEWEFICNLLSGEPFYDPSLFTHNDKWWMFTSGPGNGFLNLYFSDSIDSGWKAHPMNPLVENNSHYARPAGRVFTYDNRIFRLAQDDDPYYGIQVFAAEVTELSEINYKEKIDSLNPVITLSNKGWNSAGMHHADIHQMDNTWSAVVDGLKRTQYKH